MKLIYIHIPKTAGSSINNFLEQSIRQGIWLRNQELELHAKDIWNLDYLSGHFTRNDLFLWMNANDLNHANIRIMTVIRHPMDQLQSNLSFPYELMERGYDIQEEWMNDILKIDLSSPSAICNFLSRHRWILNLQWQYLVTGATLEEALEYFDHISIFPSVATPIHYAANVLDIPAQNLVPHENRSRRKFISKSVFSSPMLKDILLNEHALDMELYLKIIRRKLMTYDLEEVSGYLPKNVGMLFDDWINR